MDVVECSNTLNLHKTLDSYELYRKLTEIWLSYLAEMRNFLYSWPPISRQLLNLERLGIQGNVCDRRMS